VAPNVKLWLGHLVLAASQSPTCHPTSSSHQVFPSRPPVEHIAKELMPRSVCRLTTSAVQDQQEHIDSFWLCATLSPVHLVHKCACRVVCPVFPATGSPTQCAGARMNCLTFTITPYGLAAAAPAGLGISAAGLGASVAAGLSAALGASAAGFGASVVAG
jgi:hypothetical protein